MSISTLYSAQMANLAFSRQTKDIADLQEQISSGKNDPRVSADPVRASRLSVAEEQQARMERYADNLSQVQDRLTQTDSTLSEVMDITQRLKDIALRGASDTVNASERDSLAVEVRELRGALLDMANARDSMGRNLFGGFRTDGTVFTEGTNGVEYGGDGARNTVRVSESSSLPTGLDGAAVFMTVQNGDKADDVFSMVDDLLVALARGGSEWAGQATSENVAELSVNALRRPDTYSFTLSGPGGDAEVSADLVAGVPGPLVDAINAKTAETGVTARLSDDGLSLVLEADGTIGMSDIETGQRRRDPVFAMTRYDENGGRITERANLVVPEMTQNGLVSTFSHMTDHFADTLAEVGGLGQVAETHQNSIDARQLAIKTAIAELEDLDIAAAVTTLQQKMLTLEVSQQTYVKISQNSLFDYLR